MRFWIWFPPAAFGALGLLELVNRVWGETAGNVLCVPIGLLCGYVCSRASRRQVRHFRHSDPRDRARAGFVYLLHFDVPYWHAKHYSGFTQAPNGARWEAQLIGRGARLLQVLAALGIGWRPARVWRGTRDDERRLKNLGGAARSCPLCTPRPYPIRWMRELERAAPEPEARPCA